MARHVLEVRVSELIPILSRPIGDSVNAIDARELHRALNIGRDFSTWIRARLDELHLTEGSDYVKLNDSASPNLGSANRIDYVLTLDAAKHIAMAQRNEIGTRVRNYFITAEKKLRTISSDPIALLSDPNVLRSLLSSYAERTEKAEAALAVAAPKVEVFDRIIDCGDTEGFRAAAKLVREATGATEGEFRSLMLKRKWIARLDGRLMPAHYGTEHGYVTTRDREWDDDEGGHHVKAELRITQKGIARAIELLLAGSEAAE